MLQAKLDEFRKMKKKIGFVPTMGALHKGHLSLTKRASEENDIVVVSIFVNPTQFNNPDDLKNYPKTPEKDSELLEENNTDILFSPDVNEIYDLEEKKRNELPLGKLEVVMEGAHRPGHFSGVVRVVSRLFEIVKPDNAYFGEKDFQQLAVIRYMTLQMGYPVKIIGCQTIRAQSGLALSSRNLRLTTNGLKDATAIYESLMYVKQHWEKKTPDELKRDVVNKIESKGKLKVEYIEIADDETLEKVNSWKGHKHVRCFAAVYCENIRLIDNIQLF